MQYYRFPQQKLLKAAFALIMLWLLLMTRDAMYSMMVWDFYTCQFLSLGLMALMGVSFLLYNRKHLKEILLDPRMAILLTASVVMLLPMAVKQDWQLMYFSILLGVLFAVFLSYFVTLKEVAFWYVITIAVIGAWSILCTYVLRIFVDNGIFAVPLVTNSTDTLFHNFGLAIVPDTYVKYRNFGIFREPGVFQFFVLIAIYLNNYHLEWNQKRQLWVLNGILAVTMLTTFATGGMIELCLLACVMFVDKKWYRDRRICIAALILAALAGAVVAYCIAEQNDLYWALWDMVNKFTSNPESTGSRLNSIAVGIEIFFRSPFFGESVDSVLHAIVDYSASTLILYNIFGFLGGSLNVLGWVALVWKRDQKVWVSFAVIVILFMSFNTQMLAWNIFFWLFPMLALTERAVPLLKRIKKV